MLVCNHAPRARQLSSLQGDAHVSRHTRSRPETSRHTLHPPMVAAHTPPGPGQHPSPAPLRSPRHARCDAGVDAAAGAGGGGGAGGRCAYTQAGPSLTAADAIILSVERVAASAAPAAAAANRSALCCVYSLWCVGTQLAVAADKRVQTSECDESACHVPSDRHAQAQQASAMGAKVAPPRGLPAEAYPARSSKGGGASGAPAHNLNAFNDVNASNDLHASSPRPQASGPQALKSAREFARCFPTGCVGGALRSTCLVRRVALADRARRAMPRSLAASRRLLTSITGHVAAAHRQARGRPAAREPDCPDPRRSSWAKLGRGRQGVVVGA